ncbi:MAG TPA: glutamate synthase-related protein, partial [Thermoleophilia bacterium]|nr:glutamate synthase-related protein [Thermoleophilia bacterium]
AAATDAVRSGAEIVVLSDRVDEVGAETSHVPPLLAVGAAHQHLLHEGLRCRASLVVETGQCWSIHHLACLIGYGASAVSPYLAFETVRRLWTTAHEGADAGDAVAGANAPAGAGNAEAGGDAPAAADGAAAARTETAVQSPLARISVEQAQVNYRLSAERGLLKILSKMGISLLASYHGAQLFEALGIGDDLLALAFAGTPSRIGGLSLEELARETVWTHQRAFPELTAEKLENYGFIRYRRGGEYHLNNPEAAKTLRRACVEDRSDLYARYRARLSERPPTVLRDLLRLRSDRAPIAVDEVEAAREIARRFSTGGMSMGALSREAHETLAIAMNRIGGRANSGEGGEDVARYVPIDDVNGDGSSARFPHLRGLRSGDLALSRIKQVASGRFGVTPEYLASAEQLEIKIAQGAKPGEGGELPGNKVTAYIASLRRSQPGATLISPPPHHDIYSIEDLAQLVHDLKEVNPSAEISVKLVAGWGVGTIAVGVAKAGADVIHVSGHGGGTAAASLNSIRHAGIPWELGLVETQGSLIANGLRSRVRLRVDGDLRTGHDIVMAALLGADEFAFGTAVLMAEGCVMARVCHTNRCPVGIATQDEQLRKRFTGEPEHVVNFFTFVAEEARSLLAELGCRSLDEVVGRADLLAETDRAGITKTAGIDLAWMCAPVPGDRNGRRNGGLAARSGSCLDERLLAESEVRTAIAAHGTVKKSAAVTCADRTIGTRIAGAIARSHGDGSFRGDVRLELRGSAGQSLGAFLLDGMSVLLEGEANDYVGKGMAGGRIVLCPPSTAEGNGRSGAEGGGQRHSEGNRRPPVVAGNTCLYGATGGTLMVAGAVGERFAVRNSGGSAVIEGAGDHCCEYMTGGTVVVLGPVGRNACAGMTGGTAYFLDDGALSASLNGESVVSEPVTDVDGSLEELLRAHLQHTRSDRARQILARWPRSARRFARVTARRQ